MRSILLVCAVLVALTAPSAEQGAPGCSGHTDHRSGCPGDPAHWTCARQAYQDKTHDVRECHCQIHCDDDGNQTGESSDCPRWCDKGCECHVEEKCPGGAARH